MTLFRISTLAIALAAAGACSNNGGEPEREPRTHKVVRAELVVAVSATGVVEPEYEVEVKSKASGEILEFSFEPGDEVKKGQVLIRLDQKTEKRNVALTETDLARAEAELKSARANLLEKELTLKRTRSLISKNLVSTQELDVAVTRAAVASARISEVEAALRRVQLAQEEARERLDETVIESPIDGVIVEKAVGRGQIITSGITSVTGGTRLLVVADLSRLYVYAMVDETDIGMVQQRQKASITVDAYPNRAFEGVVKRIYPTGETSDNITAFRVKVEIMDSKKDLLRPGMTANVDIIQRSKPGALIVPDEAISYDPDDEKRGVVTIKAGDSHVEREVILGDTNGFETEVVSGLAEGDLALIMPPARR